MVQNYTIYGERCSGTNYLENLIQLNFDSEITWEYGWKHFFGFQEEELKNSDNTLFICIVRDIKTWINSFYREKHHWPFQYIKLSKEEEINTFLNYEFYSVFDDSHPYKTSKDEIMEDRNIYTGERYKNIFELRHIKNKYLIEDLPKKVKNYIFIRYEDLIDNFEDTMNKIKLTGLPVKKDIIFPINTENYKNTNMKYIKNKPKHIVDEIILNNLIPQYEKILKYI